jgi:hypothetical protein
MVGGWWENYGRVKEREKINVMIIGTNLSTFLYKTKTYQLWKNGFWIIGQHE